MKIEDVRTIFAPPPLIFFNRNSSYGARGLQQFWGKIPHRGFLPINS